MKDFFNYYEILEVGETDDLEEIKKSYRSKALQYHPDRVPEHLKKKSEEIFKQISEAYEVLSDPEKRKQYDEGLKNLKTGQPFDQTNSSENPVLQVDKTRFEFKDLRWGTVVSDRFCIFNAGAGTLTGTMKAVMGWVSLSECAIDTPYMQEIEITVDTAEMLAGHEVWEEIEIQTNGGAATVHIEISTAFRSNMDTVISLARSIASKRWLMPLSFTISLIFVVTLFLGNPISTYVRNLQDEALTASSKPRQEADEDLCKFPPKLEDVREDVAIFQTLFNKRGPVGYAPVVRERRDAAGNVLERRVEYLRKEEMESILADNEEQKIYYPKTGSFYPIKKSRYPEFYKKCDLDDDGVITLYELGKMQHEFNRITAKYPEGDVDSVVKDFIK